MIKCGNCKELHNTVQEVKDCYTLGQPATAAQVATAQAKGTQPATERQRAFVATLVAERAHGWPDPDAVLAGVYTSKQATSGLIQKLLEMPKVEGCKRNNFNPGVPEGYYAVPSATGNNDLDFYVVQCPDKGEWQGYTFVKRVIGGRPDVRVRGTEAKAVLKRIVEAGPEQAAQRYGQEIGQCGRCNRHLTDELSRQLGIGPVCREQAW